MWFHFIGEKTDVYRGCYCVPNGTGARDRIIIILQGLTPSEWEVNNEVENFLLLLPHIT